MRVIMRDIKRYWQMWGRDEGYIGSGTYTSREEMDEL